jgi:hypothetical protein
MQELCARLEQAYPEVPAEQMQADVNELLEQLREQKLLVDAA